MPVSGRKPRRAMALAFALALVMTWPAGAGTKPVRCGDGTTMFRQGGVRIFAVYLRVPQEFDFDFYACTPRHRTPVSVGQSYETEGTGSLETSVFAISGGRYLGSYTLEDGEGGPSSSFAVDDLATGRGRSFNAGATGENPPELRVDGNGDLLIADEEVTLKRRGKAGQTLSTPGVPVRGLALTGATAYWTERPSGAPAQAYSATLPGAPGGGESRALEPIFLRTKRDACATAPGTTIAASPSIRVYERRPFYSTRPVRRACRIGRAVRVRLDEADPPPRIVHDRWLLSLSGALPADGAEVTDMRTGRLATRVSDSNGMRAVTMLRSGALVWLEDEGPVLARLPGTHTTVELAAAEPLPRGLAASADTVYWTAGGVAHGARLTPTGWRGL